MPKILWALNSFLRELEFPKPKHLFVEFVWESFDPGLHFLRNKSLNLNPAVGRMSLSDLCYFTTFGCGLSRVEAERWLKLASLQEVT